jgi:hypothetical protein
MGKTWRRGSTSVLAAALVLPPLGCSSETAQGDAGPEAGSDAATQDVSTSDAPKDAPAPTDAAAVDAGPGGGAVAVTTDGTSYSTSAALLTNFGGPAISAGFTGVVDPHNLSFRWPDMAGTFDAQGGLYISWSEKQGNVWVCDKNVMGSSCTITVTQFSKTTGAPVKGTFSGTLVRSTGMVGPATRVLTNGTFDMQHP